MRKNWNEIQRRDHRGKAGGRGGGIRATPIERVLHVAGARHCGLLDVGCELRDQHVDNQRISEHCGKLVSGFSAK